MQKRVLMLVVLVGLALASPTMAGPYDWFAWTGETSNDYMDVNNWRWAGGVNTPFGTKVLGSADTFVHPTDVGMLLAQRHEIGQAIGAAQGGPLPRTANLDGSSGAYLAWNGGLGLNQTYGAIEIDSGMTFNIYNGAKYTVGGVSANGFGTDPYQDSIDLSRTYQGNHLKTTVYVTTGGSFTASSWTGNISSTGYTANAGIFAEGKATVNITGNYLIGGPTPQTRGGGHLTVKGYDADSVLTIANGDGQKIFMGSASYERGFDGMTAQSDPAELRIILDASNDGGLFNTVQTNMLDLRSRYIDPIVGETDMYRPVKFTVELDGYTVTAGQVFAIIVADSITNDGGTTLNTLGVMDKGWNTTFEVDGVAMQFHQTYNGQSGVFLEVMPIPEPATMSLLALGGLAALIRRRRQ
ncbi:MAG: PEP-CTERM sorting domain-containing protein [Planctomycetaceae bacterium]|nr:PEP-CTERM sorting domain-containing protein [Planctomycetaceae bacterium]